MVGWRWLGLVLAVLAAGVVLGVLGLGVEMVVTVASPSIGPFIGALLGPRLGGLLLLSFAVMLAFLVYFGWHAWRPRRGRGGGDD